MMFTENLMSIKIIYEGCQFEREQVGIMGEIRGRSEKWENI